MRGGLSARHEVDQAVGLRSAQALTLRALVRREEVFGVEPALVAPRVVEPLPSPIDEHRLSLGRQLRDRVQLITLDKVRLEPLAHVVGDVLREVEELLVSPLVNEQLSRAWPRHRRRVKLDRVCPSVRVPTYPAAGDRVPLVRQVEQDERVALARDPESKNRVRGFLDVRADLRPLVSGRIHDRRHGVVPADAVAVVVLDGARLAQHVRPTVAVNAPQVSHRDDRGVVRVRRDAVDAEQPDRAVIDDLMEAVQVIA